MTSLSCLMSGLYSPETRINYQRTSRTPYATALGVNFQKLGYRTRLFYGGRLSWQRLGEFARSQGFDETFGQESIAEEGQSNEWGADDGALYDYALKSVPEDVPSFNLILTTTNHPPYSLDLGKVGWKGATLSPELAKIADGDLTDRHMGHLWYTDREIGRFVRAAAEKFRPAVFAVTGDHFSRRFLNKKPTTYEGSAVPLILYGPEVLGSVKVPDRIAGSHLDIAPTLLELCAPAGFSYHTLARNILAPSPLPLAFGRGEVIGPDFILDDAPDAKPEPLPWAALGAPLPASSLSNLAAARDRYRKMVGLSWWRVMKGNDLSKTDK
jgi:phosphoglycerol transferase MdoB-like AlkP superfamily enzyme